MQNLKTCDAEIIYMNSGPGPILCGSLEAEDEVSYDPIWMMESQAYTEGTAKWNTAGFPHSSSLPGCCLDLDPS